MPIPKYRLDDLSEAGEESTSSPLAQVLGAVVLGKNDHPTSERTFGSKPSCTSNCSCDYDCKNHCYCVDNCRCDTNCRRDCSLYVMSDAPSIWIDNLLLYQGIDSFLPISLVEQIWI